MNIGIHILSSAQPGNFNRDQYGLPKSLDVGGVPRIFWSSQSQRATTRRAVAEYRAQHDPEFFEVRTKRLVEEVLDSFVRQGIDPFAGTWDGAKYNNDLHEFVNARIDSIYKSGAREKAEATASKAETTAEEKMIEFVTAQTLFSTMTESDSGYKKAKADMDKAEKAATRAADTAEKAKESAMKVGALFLVTSRAIDEFARLVASDSQGEGNKGTVPQRDAFAALSSEVSLEIAAFGRMFAGAPEMTVDASVQTAIAFGTGNSGVSEDYFVAMDTRDELPGVIGEKYIAAPLMYRYTNVNVDALRANIDNGRDVALSEDELNALLTAIIAGVPEGMQTTTGTAALPHTVVITVGDTAFTGATAFVRPINGPTEATSALLRNISGTIKGFELPVRDTLVWTLEGDIPAGVTAVESVPSALRTVAREALA